MLMNALQHITDGELVERIAAFNRSEREAAAALVAHLAELERRDLHLALGFRSLYGYCRAVLRLSEHESYSRMEAAHAVRRFPVIVAMVAEGLLHLTAVRLLAPLLGDENHLALLGGAIHKSKVEVKELLAAWFPKPDVRTSIRRVAAPAAAAADAATREPAPVAPAVPGPALILAPNPRLQPPAMVEAGAPRCVDAPVAKAASVAVAPGEPVAPARPPARQKASIDPLSAESYAVRLTARRATIERLRRAQELLSHAIPDGDVDEILYRALGELIEKEGRRKLAATRPRVQGQGQGHGHGHAARPVDPATRTVTAEVEREVRRRDGDQCAFVATDGRRCAERVFLELHHVKPWIAGGRATARNIALRCRAHNAYEWKVYVAPINAAREVATRSGTS
jgi:hypothetical protein